MAASARRRCCGPRRRKNTFDNYMASIGPPIIIGRSSLLYVYRWRRTSMLGGASRDFFASAAGHPDASKSAVRMSKSAQRSRSGEL